MRISDWSSDVCSSDLAALHLYDVQTRTLKRLDGDWMPHPGREGVGLSFHTAWLGMRPAVLARPRKTGHVDPKSRADWYVSTDTAWRSLTTDLKRSEEHTSELQSLMRISYAVFCLKKKKLE